MFRIPAVLDVGVGLFLVHAADESEIGPEVRVDLVVADAVPQVPSLGAEVEIEARPGPADLFEVLSIAEHGPEGEAVALEKTE